MKTGLLIILSGPSGVGKGTIRKAVMEDPSLNLVYSISMTTRARRPYETDKVDYFFVTRDQFDQQIKKGNLLEWAEFVGNRYGTPKDYVLTQLKKGNNVFLEIEVEGAKQVMEKMKDYPLLTFFLMPPKFSDLEERIRKRRTEPEAVVQERLAKANREMKLYVNYQHVVINDEVERATREIQTIIKERIAKLQR